MAITIDANKTPRDYTFYLEQMQGSKKNTGSTIDFAKYLGFEIFNRRLTNHFTHSRSENDFTQHNIFIKKYIEYINLIKNQYEQLAEFYDDVDLSSVISKTSGVVSYLLNISPDALSIELTNEKSIFYTVKIQNFSFYIHQYFETDEDDGFNTTLVKYYSNKKLESLNGDVSMAIIEIQRCIMNNNIVANKDEIPF
jgi:hypothetical protein